jgi:hypothetical protein
MTAKPTYVRFFMPSPLAKTKRATTTVMYHGVNKFSQKPPDPKHDISSDPKLFKIILQKS